MNSKKATSGDDFYRAGFEAMTGAARTMTKRQAVMHARLDLYADPDNWRGLIFKGPRPDGAQDGGALARAPLPDIGEDCLGTLIRIAELARLAVINDGFIQADLPPSFVKAVDLWTVYIETRPEVAALIQQGDNSHDRGNGQRPVGADGDAGGPGAAADSGAHRDAGDARPAEPALVGEPAIDQSIPF